MTLPSFKDWPLELQKKWREQSKKGGKAGSKKDKSRAGKLGYAARIEKARERAGKLNQHPNNTDKI